MRLTLLVALLPGCGSLGYYDRTEVGDDDTGADLEPATTLEGATPNEPPAEPPTDPTPDTGTTPSTPSTPSTYTPPVPVAITIATIDPEFGPNSGGTSVTVTGSFDAATTFTFNGVNAPVQSITATEAVVDTPSVGVVGDVDVEAVSGARSDVLNNAFQYFDDFGGTTGTAGAISFTHMVGGYWTAPPVDYADGIFLFTQGSDWEIWKDYHSTQNGCTIDFVPSYSATAYEPGASDLSFSSGAAVATLDHLPGILGPGWFRELALVPNVDVVPGSTYDLDPVAGNADWPGFGVSNMIRIPPNFVVSDPPLNSVNMPTQTKMGFDVVWGGVAADLVVIRIERQWYDDSVPEWVPIDVLTCAVPDNGSYTIPGNVWPDWFENDVLLVRVGRVDEGTGTLPHDGSENRAAGIYWVSGAVQAI